MKIFLKKLILLSLPFVLYFILVLMIDPFDYLNRKGLIDKGLKEKIAIRTEPHLSEIISWQNEPKKNIILGDSRSNDLFHSIPWQDRWGNLSYEEEALRKWWTHSGGWQRNIL